MAEPETKSNGVPIISPETIKLGYNGQLGDKQAAFNELIERNVIPAKDTFFGEIADSAKEFLFKLKDGTVDMWTGDSKREFPEIKEIPKQLRGAFSTKGNVGSKLALGRDDLRKVDIFRDMFGNVPAELDKFGNAIVNLDDSFAKRFKMKPGKYYLNEPGASSQDIDDIMTTGLSEIFFSRLGGKIGGKLIGGTLGKIIGVGGGAGGGSIAQDLAAGVAGSERGVDPISALVATAFGIGGETITQLAVPFLKRFFTNKDYIVEGKLTKSGRKILNKLNLDPDNVTTEFVTKFNQLNKTAVNPTEAARLAAAESLPQPVGLTQGDIIRKQNIQSVENDILSQNDAAGNIMSDFRVKQQNQLNENVPLIADKIAPTSVIAESPTDAAVDIVGELTKKSNAAKLRVNRLYTVARGRGKNAFINNNNLSEQLEILSKNISAYPNISTYPFGLGDKDDSHTMYKSSDPDNFAAWSIYPELNNIDSSNSTVIEVKEAKSMLNSIGIDGFDLIKIDTEGAEFSIIKSIDLDLLKKTKLIVGELHGNYDYEFLSYLNELGFNVRTNIKASKPHFMFYAISDSLLQNMTRKEIRILNKL